MFGRILSGLGRALIVAGLLVLGFVAYQLWGTSVEASRGQSDLRETLAADLGKTDVARVDLTDLMKEMAKPPEPTADKPAPVIEPPAEGEPLGVISIPRIDLKRIVVSGVSRSDLKKGPGHYPGTPMPGQAGNAGIAGHRTTYGAPFNRIDELIPGDEITVATMQGEFTYVVIPAPGQTEQAWYTVKPSQVEVLDNMGDNRLTLTACHPKYSAKQRIIVQAVMKTPPAQTLVATTAAAGSVKPKSSENTVSTTAEQFDEGLSGDPSALTTALLFGLAAAVVAGLAWFLKRYTKPWAAWAVATPAILVLIWFGYVYLDRYLPTL
ncbi:MAG TPA: class E sortase [Microthrixaceae bacterium]|nr:class E sortase [Microthrixaceae bacterium]